MPITHVSYAPKDYLVGYASDGLRLSLPLGPFGITPQQADPANGDIREVVHALLGLLWANYLPHPAFTPPSIPPAEMQVTQTRSSPALSITGDTVQLNLTETYTIKFGLSQAAPLGGMQFSDQIAQ